MTDVPVGAEFVSAVEARETFVVTLAESVGVEGRVMDAGAVSVAIVSGAVIN